MASQIWQDLAALGGQRKGGRQPAVAIGRGDVLFDSCCASALRVPIPSYEPSGCSKLGRHRPEGSCTRSSERERHSSDGYGRTGGRQPAVAIGRGDVLFDSCCASVLRGPIPSYEPSGCSKLGRHRPEGSCTRSQEPGRHSAPGHIRGQGRLPPATADRGDVAVASTGCTTSRAV